MIEWVRICLLLFLVSSWVPWFLKWRQFTLQVVCSSTKFFNHISLLYFPSFSFISMSIWTLKTCLRFFLAIIFGALALFHVLFGSSSSLLNIIGSSSFFLAFVRCILIVRHFNRFNWILMHFNQFNWQEMDFHMSFGVVAQVLVSSWIKNIDPILEKCLFPFQLKLIP